MRYLTKRDLLKVLEDLPQDARVAFVDDGGRVTQLGTATTVLYQDSLGALSDQRSPASSTVLALRAYLPR